MLVGAAGLAFTGLGARRPARRPPPRSSTKVVVSLFDGTENGDKAVYDWTGTVFKRTSEIPN